MGETRLRYAESGAFVENTDGGIATPGIGFQARRVVVQGTNVQNLQTSLNATPLTTSRPQLAKVGAGRRYRAELLAYLTKTGLWTGTGTVFWTFQYSANSGANFTTWATHEVVYAGPAEDENVTESIQTLPVLGSSLTGVTEGATLEVQVLGVLQDGADEGLAFRSPIGIALAFIEEL